jgi:hypothetical protein
MFKDQAEMREEYEKVIQRLKIQLEMAKQARDSWKGEAERLARLIDASV